MRYALCDPFRRRRFIVFSSTRPRQELAAMYRLDGGRACELDIRPRCEINASRVIIKGMKPLSVVNFKYL